MKKRYIVEFGTGVDLHGMDVTKAACKAVKDAVSHGCLCGITEILEVTNPAEKMQVVVKIASPFPEKIDRDAVLKMIPFGTPTIEVEEGGLKVTGLEVKALGEGNQIVMVNAALTVWIDLP